RAGTPAALMPQLPPGIAAARAKTLRQAGDAALQRHLTAQTGKILTVLTERGGTARAEDFTKVRVGNIPAGRLMNARIGRHDGKMLIAEALS
ncbi:MAG TPA: tRNA (N(6)-L-threonylcarbamoyladenosine(37)-C(2))-methylthiotransferase MtaB, partial [Methylovirgula sp.]